MNRLIYTVGTGFSGSTLFSFLLNGHPEIASVGESTGPLRDPLSYPCSCGQLLPDCHFWRAVASNMNEHGFAFAPDHWNLDFRIYKNWLLNQLVSRSLRSNVADSIRDELVFSIPSWKRTLVATGRRYDAFVASVLQTTSKSVFMDACKDPVRARYLLRLSASEVRVIHLVRDAPGFVSSFMKNQGGSLDLGVRYWNRTAAHARRLESRLPPDRFLRIHYEDLCVGTEDVLGRVATFAAVGPFHKPISFRQSSHHIIGNRMRTKTSNEIVLDQSWRDRLTRKQLDTILRRTRSTRHAVSYI